MLMKCHNGPIGKDHFVPVGRKGKKLISKAQRAIHMNAFPIESVLKKHTLKTALLQMEALLHQDESLPYYLSILITR